VKPASRHVSLMLLPVHTHPELRAGLSPRLTRCLTGKATFTFAVAEEAVFEELEVLAARACEVYVTES